MNFLLAVLSAGIGSGLMAIVLAWLQRKWKKADRKEEKEEEQEEATIAELKDEIKRLAVKVDNSAKANAAVVTAQKIIMVERIRYLGMCYISSGNIDLDDKEQMRKMHKAYKALGGNGDLDTVMDEVEHLPLKKEPKG